MKMVTYSVDAMVTMPVDIDTVKTTVHQTIQDAHLTGMQMDSTPIATDDGSGNNNTDSGDGTNGDGDSTTNTPVGDTGSSDTGSTIPYTATDSAMLTYTTTAERDQLLQQILTFWQTALRKFKSANLRKQITEFV